MSYDSTPETEAHIERVQTLCEDVSAAILTQSEFHDESKLESPEKEAFDVATPKLKGLTYGSPEYKQALVDLGPALQHHYANNAHHPESHLRGVRDMTLIDVIEMLCDWKAATERHADGNLAKSLVHNRQRFGITDQLGDMLENTAVAMGWVTEKEIADARA
jgi:hypothetical protein